MSEWKATQEEVLDLISDYYRCQCLWNYRCAEYKRVDLKKSAWLQLSKKYKRDIPVIKKKIKYLRCTYVIEKKKVDDSKKPGSPLENYHPHLFYFDEFAFLDSVIVLRKTPDSLESHMADTKKRSKAWQYFISLPGRKARCKFCGKILSFKGGGPFNLTRHIKSQHLVAYTASCEENKVADGDRTTMKGKQSSPSSTPAPTAVSTPAPAPIPASTSQALTVQKPALKKFKSRPNPAAYTNPYPSSYSKQLPTTRDNPPPPPRQVQRSHQDREVHICSSCPCIAAQESEFDKIGKAWASELQKMTPEQQIYAKRAIAEIIFEGQLGALHRDSVIINHIEPRVVEEASPFLIEKEEPDFNC